MPHVTTTSSPLISCNGIPCLIIISSNNWPTTISLHQNTNHVRHQQIHLTFDQGERSRTDTVEDLLLPEKKEGYGSGWGRIRGEVVAMVIQPLGAKRMREHIENRINILAS
jgi:hypothetical protein